MQPWQVAFRSSMNFFSSFELILESRSTCFASAGDARRPLVVVVVVLVANGFGRGRRLRRYGSQWASRTQNSSAINKSAKQKPVVERIPSFVIPAALKKKGKKEVDADRPNAYPT